METQSDNTPTHPALISSWLETTQLGTPQTHRHLTLFPLLRSVNGLVYQTMGEAFRAGALQIQEVSSGGSVPDLQAVNTSALPVLLLDGEELRGAKQNRVLNTSILLAAHSKLVVLVSCTESGRWSYSRPDFEDSRMLMSAKSREFKQKRVSLNYEQMGRPVSDQGEVWARIEHETQSLGGSSRTSAMRDVYEQQAGNMDEYQRAFTALPGQCGLLAVLNGKPLGCDLLSRTEAYASVHTKLVQSYVIDALQELPLPKTEDAQATGPAFLAAARHCTCRSFAAVGLGADVRMDSAIVSGAALVVDHTVVHLSLFAGNAATSPDQLESMRSARRRAESRPRHQS